MAVIKKKRKTKIIWPVYPEYGSAQITTSFLLNGNFDLVVIVVNERIRPTFVQIFHSSLNFLIFWWNWNIYWRNYRALSFTNNIQNICENTCAQNSFITLAHHSHPSYEFYPNFLERTTMRRTHEWEEKTMRRNEKGGGNNKGINSLFSPNFVHCYFSLHTSYSSNLWIARLHVLASTSKPLCN